MQCIVLSIHKRSSTCNKKRLIFYLLIVIPGFDSDEQAEKILFSLNANMMAV